MVVFTTAAFQGFAVTDTNGKTSERSSMPVSRLRFLLPRLLTVEFFITALVAKPLSSIRKISFSRI